MRVTVSFSLGVTPPVLDLKPIGEAIFSEWYPDWDDGDLLPVDPPAAVVAEAGELARQHKNVKIDAILASLG